MVGGDEWVHTWLRPLSFMPAGHWQDCPTNTLPPGQPVRVQVPLIQEWCGLALQFACRAKAAAT